MSADCSTGSGRATAASVKPKVEIHEQFKYESDLPGDVLLRCRGVNFYVHKSIIYYASTFFSALLDGDWVETSYVKDVNTSNAESQKEVNDKEGDAPQEMDPEKEDGAPSKGTAEGDDGDGKSFTTALAAGDTDNGKNSALATDNVAAHSTDSAGRLLAPLPRQRSVSTICREEQLVAVIDLHEEDPVIVHDVLHHIYPNLELSVTWFNLEKLLAFDDKYDVPFLRQACTTFLNASLAGKPIQAMAVSQVYGLDDIYREASRHVLDNMAAWDRSELSSLGPATLYKLEHRRAWFLERLLKLGLTNPSRDYTCHNACPDKSLCTRELDTRWKALHTMALSDGPPQPSVIWRALRELEGNRPWSPQTRINCVAAYKAWSQNLFDRMYGTLGHFKATPKFLHISLNPKAAAASHGANAENAQR